MRRAEARAMVITAIACGMVKLMKLVQRGNHYKEREGYTSGYSYIQISNILKDT